MSLRFDTRTRANEPLRSSDQSLLGRRLVVTGSQRRLQTVSGMRTGGSVQVAHAEPARASDSRLVFILSTERAGSTLLSLVLGAHTRVVSPPEMHLLAYDDFDAWQRGYPRAMDSLSFLLTQCGLSMSPSEIAATFHGWSPESLYRWILDERLAEDRILIDKTPKYARDLGVLARLETLSPHYIWLIRHPLDVAASQIVLRRNRRARRSEGVLDRLKYGLFMLREQTLRKRLLHDELLYWRRVNSNISAFLEQIDPQRHRRVCFENLVREPEREAASLCEWLGLDLEPAMLNPTNRVPEQMNTETGDPKIRTHRRIDPGVVGTWHRFFSPHDLDPATRWFMQHWGVPAA